MLIRQTRPPHDDHVYRVGPADWLVSERTQPWLSRWTRIGRHRVVILHTLAPSQSMHVSAVNVSLTAGDNALIAISTS